MMTNAAYSHYAVLWAGRVHALKCSVDYCKDALSTNLAPWERKEYEAVLADNERDLVVAKEMLRKVINNLI